MTVMTKLHQNGAFFIKNTSNQPKEGVCIPNSGQREDWFGFDASKSNSIYGNSTTVQPPAVTMRFYIKYK